MHNTLLDFVHWHLCLSVGHLPARSSRVNRFHSKVFHAAAQKVSLFVCVCECTSQSLRMSLRVYVCLHARVSQYRYAIPRANTSVCVSAPRPSGTYREWEWMNGCRCGCCGYYFVLPGYCTSNILNEWEFFCFCFGERTKARTSEWGK